MLFCSFKYLNRFFLKSVLNIGFIFAFAIAGSAQISNANIVGSYPVISPLLLSAFKKPLKPNPLLAERIKPTKHELMYWPNYPMTAAQIEARNREWDRKNSQSLGRQIANDIIETTVEKIINGGNKGPVAVRPKF